MRHWFSIRSFRGDLPPEIVRTVQGWMLAKEVGEVSLEPVGRYYMVRLNADTSPVPGVYLPESALLEKDTLLDLLQTALEIYYDEMNLDQ
ncbi:hypothetical protein [Oceanithermus sp.]